MAIAGALITAGAVAGVGGIASSFIGADAATSAADTAAAAQGQAADTQMKMFQQTQSNLSPYMSEGTTSLNALMGLEGLPAAQSMQPGQTPGSPSGGYFIKQVSSGGGPGGSYQIFKPDGTPQSGVFDGNAVGIQQGVVNQLNQSVGVSPGASGAGTAGQPVNLSSVMNSPLFKSYASVAGNAPDLNTMAKGLTMTPASQFQMSQGITAANNAASSRGGVVSGNTLKALDQFGQGVANQDLYNQFNASSGQYWNNYNAFTGNQNRILQALTGQVQSGQNSAAGVGQLGAAAAGQIGAAQIGGGNALAAGQIGQANAINSGIGSIANIGNNAAQSYLLANYLQNQGMGGQTPIYGLNSVNYGAPGAPMAPTSGEGWTQYQ